MSAENSDEASLISRRSLLKKSVYTVPALLVLGSVAQADDLSFPGGPFSAPPDGTNRPPSPGDPPSGD